MFIRHKPPGVIMSPLPMLSFDLLPISRSYFFSYFFMSSAYLALVFAGTTTDKMSDGIDCRAWSLDTVSLVGSGGTQRILAILGLES